MYDVYRNCKIFFCFCRVLTNGIVNTWEYVTEIEDKSQIKVAPIWLTISSNATILLLPNQNYERYCIS